ncbi:MAG: RNA polymerase sigma factor [Halomonadaceae bacterium]|nr:MAG: RNA polymerase sigma factor [Halomonadaceae bacterium]
MDFDRDTLNTLYQYCLVLSGDRDKAYDLLYESIEKFLQQGPAEATYPLAYIRRIARNHWFDGLRREKVVAFESLPDPDIYTSLGNSLESQVLDQITLERIWQTLSPADREVLYFWAVQGMSAGEIGLHLELPRSTVLSRISRVRQRLTSNTPAMGSGGNHE